MGECPSRPGSGRLSTSRAVRDGLAHSHIDFGPHRKALPHEDSTASRPAPFSLRRTLSVYHLFGAALSLVSGGCLIDDRSPATSQPSPSFPAPADPASGAPDEMPAAQGPAEATETGTPTTSPAEGQQATELAMPRGAGWGERGRGSGQRRASGRRLCRPGLAHGRCHERGSVRGDGGQGRRSARGLSFKRG